MPVEFISLVAETNKNDVDLTWEVANELNNEVFYIEKWNLEQAGFLAIGNVAGRGNSNEIETYTWTDTEANRGENIYRIKQVDFDGEYIYSDIVKAYFSDVSSVNVYPNPANDMVVVSNEDELIDRISILDISGKDLWSENILSNTKLIDLTDLPNGLYSIQVESGNRREVRKLSVVR